MASLMRHYNVFQCKTIKKYENDIPSFRIKSIVTHTRAISNPPPNAGPSIAATRGFLAAKAWRNHEKWLSLIIDLVKVKKITDNT